VTVSAPQVVDNADAGRFEVLVDGEIAGYAEYHTAGNNRAFTHTIVKGRFEGRGLGTVLARGALDATRQGGQKVLPFCPFIRSYIKRHPGYLDLVPTDADVSAVVGGVLDLVDDRGGEVRT